MSSSNMIRNSFQVPNFLVDDLLPHLSGPQIKVLLYLCRKTFGWNRKEDIISFGKFRDEAGVSRSSAVDALRAFVAAGLVTKTTHGTLEASSWSLNLNADPELVLQRLMPGAKTPADGDKGVLRTPAYTNGRSIQPVGLDRPEVQNCAADRPTPIPPAGLTKRHINPKPKSISLNPVQSRVEEVWEYYRVKLKRAPHFELTKQRRSMGEAGLKACETLARTKNSVRPAEDAIVLMKRAIDHLAASAWHNGDNEKGVKYIEWEQLFCGRNVRSPYKLIDFWLNEDKFPGNGQREGGPEPTRKYVDPKSLYDGPEYQRPAQMGVAS
jgi:hypothetical protein